MLYKPTNPTPYNSVIDPTGGINFSASCVNTNEITEMRLTIDNNSYKYYFDMGNTCYSDGEIGIDIDKEQSKSGYRISNSTYKRDDVVDYILCGSSSSILNSPKNYTWQVRLYQDNCNVNIGYGFIQEVYTSLDTKFDDSATCILKVRPHTNMFFNAGTNFNKNNATTSSGSTDRSKKLSSALLNYYDDKVKYNIAINGTSYKVLAYYYSSSTYNLQADTYGDPLFAYIEIAASDTDISADDEYSIYTNYIDSNEFYFQCKSAPKLTLSVITENFERELPITDGTNPSVESSNLHILYNNLKIEGKYSQSNGASVNYYRFRLYQILSDKTELLLQDTGNIYKSEITYEYSDFFSGNVYKLVFQLQDTDKKSIVKSLYITPDYKSTVQPRTLAVQRYPDHQSVIIDFNNLISIPGEETVIGAHTFNNLTAIKNDNNSFKVQDEAEGNEEDDNIHLFAEKTNVKTCFIAPKNVVTYEKIDGSDDTTTCVNPLISMTFRCNNTNTQKIFKLVDDDNHEYALYWERHAFIFYYYENTNNHRDYVVKYISPYYRSGFPNCAIATTLLTNTKLRELQQKTENALSDSNANYAVPYLAFDDLPTGTNDVNTDLYCHTEDIAKDFWWHAIIKQKQFYIKCLNPPNGETIEYERTW